MVSEQVLESIQKKKRDEILSPGVKPAVRISKVTKKFGKRIIIDNVSFDINKGEIFGIIGSSGGGKTTLLKMLVGFLVPDSGEILFEQRDVMKNIQQYPNDAKRVFGFAAQEPSFYLQLKVGENLEHFGALFGLSKKERKENADRLLKIVNLYDAKKSLAVKLSGGMRRRLGLLTATIHKPEIFVLDEPTADLDPYSRKLVLKFIKSIHEQGRTVIIASHLLEDLEGICTRIAIVHHNKVIKIGTPDELKQMYAKHKLIELETKSRKYDKIIEKIKRKENGITDLFVENRKLYIRSEDTETLLANLLNMIKREGEQLLDISIAKPKLSELFDSLIQ